MVSRVMASISSPVAGSIVMLRFSQAARNAGSLSISWKAVRSAATRSAGTPGVVRIERPISAVSAMARRAALVRERQLRQGRNVGQQGMPLERVLIEDHAFALHPVWMRSEKSRDA